MRRADFLLAFRDQHQIDGQLAPRAPDSVKRCKEGRFWSLLVHSPASHQNFADAGSINERGIPRGRRPLSRVYLFHIVHEIETNSPRSACIERSQYAGLAIRRNFSHLTKTRVSKESHREVAAFVDTLVFGCD